MANNDIQTLSNPLDTNRRLTTDVPFAEPVTIPQADMLEALDSLTPLQRTELVTDWYLFWVAVHDGMRLVE